MNMNNVFLNELVGKKVCEMKGQIKDQDFLIKTECGYTFNFYHNQDCCESVYLENIIGDINDILGHEIILAQEEINNDEIQDSDVFNQDSFTWTYYRLASEKGLVVLRFYGTSNGYYSEGITISMNPKKFFEEL